MSAWSGLGSRIIATIVHRAERKRLQAEDSSGDFYRHGGNALLFENLLLCQDDLVLDAGATKANGRPAS